MCDYHDLRLSLPCDATAGIWQRRAVSGPSGIPSRFRIDAVELGLPMTDQIHPGRSSPAALVVVPMASHLTLMRREGRVPVLLGQ